MNAATYMKEIVDPTIKDFEQHQSSRRLAFIACLVTFHCVDYLASPKNKENLRNDLRQNSDFAVVDRVAHAFKHTKAGHPSAPKNQPLEVRAVFGRPPAIAGLMECGISQCGDSVGGVEIWGEDTPDLFRVVTRAAQFLSTKLPTNQARMPSVPH